MGWLSLVQTFITAVFGFLGVVIAAMIGVHLTHRYERRNRSNQEEPDEPRRRTNAPATINDILVQRTVPWGHPQRGRSFDHNGFDGIKTIEIGWGAWIHSIRVQYTKRGELIWTPKVGGSEGKIENIVLQDGEYITEINGSFFFENRQEGLINSLTIVTNKGNQFGPYGSVGFWSKLAEQTKFFKNQGRIVGFHGTEGHSINSIGFYNLCV